ncbi:MAG: hypothetical protein IPO88_18540 [Nannocystis sp.]|uniref:hypothetical protein n=1 Tax=Nannocystis sp. TaxID=1962667 RepID=UPI002422FF85|nr:hypothetical protein [Nannocystis sp.]MBK9755466.1 hypothetical protein [Nannocystis sp.]
MGLSEGTGAAIGASAATGGAVVSVAAGVLAIAAAVVGSEGCSLRVTELSSGTGVSALWLGSRVGFGPESRRIGLTRAMTWRLLARPERSRGSGSRRGRSPTGGRVGSGSRGVAAVVASLVGCFASAATAGAGADADEAAVDDDAGRARAGEAHQAEQGLEAAAGEVAELARGVVVGDVEQAAVAVDVQHEHAAVLGVDGLEQAGDAERAADGGGELGLGEQLEADLAEDGALEQAGLGDRDDHVGRQLQGAAGGREGAQALALDAEEGDARGDLDRGLDDRLGDAVALAGLREGGEGRGHALGEALGAARIVGDRCAQRGAGVGVAGVGLAVRRAR